MTYLITQIILCLLAAFILGFIIGYFWCKGRYERDEKDRNISKANLYSLEEEIQAYRVKVDSLTSDLEDCRKSLKAAPVAAVVVPDVQEDERDDLKKIWGIGKVLEKRLNDLGIFRFSQIATMDDKDIDDLSGKIGEFPGRIRRDGWVIGARNHFHKKYGKEIK